MGIYKAVISKSKNNKYYKLLNERTPIIGTWGDEEYGILNGNGENKFKEGYKQYYLDFLDADTLDQRRNYVNLGLYSTYSFGNGYKTVRFILLDLKYNQTSFLKEDTNDMLGPEQWEWLENIFKKQKKHIHLYVYQIKYYPMIDILLKSGILKAEENYLI